MNNDDPIFIGNVSTIQTKYGDILKLGIPKDGLDTLYAHLNEKDWVNIALKTNREGTKYMQIDTWKPDEDKKQTNPQGQDNPSDVTEDEIDLEEIPF